jgi:hypothetical protein
MEQKQGKSVKEIIEKRMLPILVVMVVIASALRSAAAFSDNVFNISLLPTPLLKLTQGAIGISIAALMELMMVLAGIQWFSHMKAEHEAEFDKSLGTQQRKADIKDHQLHGKISFFCAILGAMCSIFGQMFYALSQADHPSQGEVFTDLVVAILTTVGVFYTFVIYEPVRTSITKWIEQDMTTALTGILHSVGDRIKLGTHTNQDIRTLQKALPYGQRKILEALIQRDANETMWDVSTIAERLGKNDDSGKRGIRRRMQKAREDVTYGIVEKEDGRGYEMPMAQAIRLFEDDFNEWIAKGQQRTPTGQLALVSPEFSQDGQAATGQQPDN